MIKNVNDLKSKVFYIQNIYDEKERLFLNSLAKVHSRLRFWVVLELLALWGVGFAQIYFMKQLLVNRSII